MSVPLFLVKTLIGFFFVAGYRFHDYAARNKRTRPSNSYQQGNDCLSKKNICQYAAKRL